MNYHNLFTTIHTHYTYPNYIATYNTINNRESGNLTSPITTLEITNAIKSFQPLKAHGPDGLYPYFYQNYWNKVGSSVTSFCMEVFSTQQMPPEVNKTYLCLTPKVQHPTSITQYRPISLCNTFYKLITKIIINHIKPLLLSLISPEQSVFLKNRKASDNAIIVQEIMHHLRKEGWSIIFSPKTRHR